MCLWRCLPRNQIISLSLLIIIIFSPNNIHLLILFLYIHRSWNNTGRSLVIIIFNLLIPAADCCLLLVAACDFTYQGERELGQCDPYRNASLSLFFLLSCIFIYTTQHTRLWHDFTHYISSHSLLCLDFILLYRLRNIIQSISSSDQLVSPNWHRLGTSVGPSGRSATALSSRSRVYRVKGNGETLTVIFVYVPQCQHIGVRQYRVAQGSMHVCAVSMSWLQWFILALLLLH